MNEDIEKVDITIKESGWEIRLDLHLLSLFIEEKNPKEVYERSLGYSLTTYYRKLNELKRVGLLDWTFGRAKITEKGLVVLRALNESEFLQNGGCVDKEENLGEDTKTEYIEGNRFVICSNENIDDLTNDEFIFLEYPASSYLLNIMLLISGGVRGRSNAEKLKELLNRDFKVSIAIANFENSSKQFLVFLDELIKADKIECLIVGVKNERKALSNKRILGFLEEYEFKNDKFEFSKDSVTLTPVLIFFVITYIVIVAYRFGFTFAPLAYFFIPIYFLRSILFRELRNL